jgi:heme-degrading monooxygenase HmoA
MFATIRRYESVDPSRTDELIKKAEETLAPRLSDAPGFQGYYLIQAGDRVFSSVGFYDTAEHADEANRLASDWVRAQSLETALPSAPMVTSGEVVVHKTSELVSV